jgi:outer membrane protein assembly factor BamD (BamD/ComL family)
MKYFSILILASTFFIACESAQVKHSQRITALKTALENDKIGLNDTLIHSCITEMESFAKTYPKDSMAPAYLFDAAAMYRYMHLPGPALEIYKKIHTQYPTFNKAPECLFIQGLVLAEEMNDKPAGEKIYKEFIAKYPEHFLTPQVKILLTRINMTDEELMASFNKGE